MLDVVVYEDQIRNINKDDLYKLILNIVALNGMTAKESMIRKWDNQILPLLDEITKLNAWFSSHCYTRTMLQRLLQSVVFQFVIWLETEPRKAMRYKECIEELTTAAMESPHFRVTCSLVVREGICKTNEQNGMKILECKGSTIKWCNSTHEERIEFYREVTRLKMKIEKEQTEGVNET